MKFANINKSKIQQNQKKKKFLELNSFEFII